MRDGRLCPEKRPLYIDGELLIEGVVETLVGYVNQGHEAVDDPSVAHEDVQLAEGPRRVVCRPLVVLQAGHVALNRENGLAEIVFQLIEAVGDFLQYRHAGALFDVPLHHRPANAGPAACHQGYSSVKPTHILQLPSTDRFGIGAYGLGPAGETPAPAGAGRGAIDGHVVQQLEV